MRRNTISLGRILGIPIGLDFSWFLVFGLMTWTLATSYFPNEFPGWPVVQYWGVGAVTAVLLFVSVLLHELGHSVVALRYRIPVRRITLFIFGGVAEIGGQPPKASAELLIAVAGPAVSLTLALLFGAVQLGLGGAGALFATAKYLAYINGSLVLFNLIPGFPLDGGRVFRAIVWGITGNYARATRIAGSVGQAFAYLFIFLGVWQALNGDLVNGLWIAFIGWFLENAAVSEMRQQQLHEMLSGYRVAQAMGRHYDTVSADMPIQELIDRHILGNGRRSFVVTRNNEAVGLLTLHQLQTADKETWPVTAIANVMLPLARIKAIAPETNLWSALEEMDRDGVNQLPVMSNGRLLGVLNREDVVSFLRALRTVRP